MALTQYTLSSAVHDALDPGNEKEVCEDLVDVVRASRTMISISIWMVVMTMRENYIVKKKQSTE